MYQICLQSWSQEGLNKLAIMIKMRTVYGCNPSLKKEQIFVQCQNPKHKDQMQSSEFFTPDSLRKHSHVTQGRFSTLQAYLVPIET